MAAAIRSAAAADAAAAAASDSSYQLSLTGSRRWMTFW